MMLSTAGVFGNDPMQVVVSTQRVQCPRVYVAAGYVEDAGSSTWLLVSPNPNPYRGIEKAPLFSLLAETVCPFSSPKKVLHIVASQVVQSRRRYEGHFETPTLMFPYTVHAGAIYGQITSDIVIAGNAMFAHNWAGEDGGEKRRLSCIA